MRSSLIPTTVLVLSLLTTCLSAPAYWSSTPRIVGKFDVPEPPVFPTQYEVQYTFTMPYTLAYQHKALQYDVHYWHNGDDGVYRTDTLGGDDSTLKLKFLTFSVVPRIDRRECFYSYNRQEEDKLQGHKGIPTNLTDWFYGGKTNYKGRDANIWAKEEKQFERTMYYYFYVSTDGHPLLLSTMGQDWFTGSHFDQYIAEFDYDSWKPGPIAEEVLEIPQVCFSSSAIEVEKGMMSSGAARAKILIPNIFRGDPEYDAHAIEHGRLHSSPAEYYMRLGVFKSNKLMIEKHNSNPEKSYTLGLNKFADWSEEEFRTVMLGNRGDKATHKVQDKAPVYEKQGIDLPLSLDWEGTPFGGIVKDQASCGSCWTFSAVATMEAAWYQATGQRLDFSEQQIVDCAWDYGVYGCDGGWAYSAIEYVVENGGIMTENDYTYIGQNDWCKFNTTEQKNGAAAYFKGFVHIPYYDLEALEEALYTKGPLAVSLDASDPHFRFYTGGVYDSMVCSRENLDHAVAIVGYGEENGKRFFKIRNSWSKFWGAQGYIKIAQNHDCGVMSNALYAVVDEEAVKKAKGN